LRRFLRHNAIALLALFVALGGTTIAATQIGKNTVTSRSIKNGQVRTPDLANRAVTTPKLRNRSVTSSKIAGKVPDSDAVDGVGFEDLNRGRMATDAPTCLLSDDFVTCVEVTLTTPENQRLLVLGSGEVDSNVSGTTNQYTECKLQVDDVDIGLSQTVGAASSGVSGAVLPRSAVALNGVTEPLAAGDHTLELECRNTSGNRNVVFISHVSAVGISSG
jgi:hypothetical protein